MGTTAWICLGVFGLGVVGGTVGFYFAYRRVVAAAMAAGTMFRR